MNRLSLFFRKIITAHERYFIRSIDFVDIFENFLISAVVAILGIRLFLALTHYPQIGGRIIHVAHMLWGGLFMLVSIILLLTFLSRSTRKLAAVVGGLGFGTFIDELGKFITRDNNYFFQPVFSIIYIIFVILYIGIYALEKYWRLSPKEYLSNSVEFIKEAIIKDLDTEEKKLALNLLLLSDRNSPITKSLINLYGKMETIKPARKNPLVLLKRNFRKLYFFLIKKPWFSTVINLFFIVKSVVGMFLVLLSTLVVLVVILSKEVTIKDLYNNSIDILNLFSSSLAGIFVIIGMFRMRRSRLAAYRLFKQSIYVSIFLVHVFSFYKNQLSAFTGLIFDIMVLITLNYMISEEQSSSIEDE